MVQNSKQSDNNAENSNSQSLDYVEIFDDMDMKIDSPLNLFDKLRLQQAEKISMEKVPGVVDKKAEVATIVLAGGSSNRFNAGIQNSHHLSKQLMEMSGKPVLTWSMDSFDAVADVGLIVVVCPEKYFKDYLDKVVDPFAFKTPVLLAPSGETRQESAFSGLEFVPKKFKYVMIHDGARPLVPPSIIKHLINSLKGNPDYDGAICAHPAIDTLKVVEKGAVCGTPDRSAIWQAQTPQIFKKEVYHDAHLAALADGFIGSDDSTLVERIGGIVKVVEGKRNNIKLTVPEDYLILASVLESLKLVHGSEFEI